MRDEKKNDLIRILFMKIWDMLLLDVGIKFFEKILILVWFMRIGIWIFYE